MEQKIWEIIQKNANSGIVLGLSVMKQLLEKMNHPERNVSLIQVAGTNGKGSVCAALLSILREAGWKTGRYNSPAVFDPLEIISINGINISEEEYEEAGKAVFHAMEELKKENLAPTMFEAQTAAAYWYFAKKKCDFAIMEAGLGGDLDATNAVDTNVISVITSVSLDHTGILGKTIEEIAMHKSGILKENGMLVIGLQKEEAKQAFLKAAKRVHGSVVQACPSVRVEGTKNQYQNDKIGEYEFPLLGDFQADNSSIAAESAWQVLKKHGIKFMEGKNCGLVFDDQILLSVIKNGLRKTVWPGRCEIIHEDPLILMDGAHNPDAAIKLRETLDQFFSDRKIGYLCGMFRDKDIRAVVKTVIPNESEAFFITAPGDRGIDAAELETIAKEEVPKIKGQSFALRMDGIKQAVNWVKEKPDEGEKKKMLVAFGSLSWLSQLRNEAENENWNEGI